jgi:D-alanyl-D-alanine carboxypeptidase/D-alanyl-D-alanine-endopeptidase (penicillin-binding protein 4)
MLEFPKNLPAGKRGFSLIAPRGVLAVLLALLLTQPVYPASKKKKTVTSSEPKTTSGWLSIVEKAEANQREEWSVFVKDLRTGETIFQHNPSVRLIPASNRKLMVFALAMDKLGPEYKFRTELGYTGKLDPATGSVSGSLVLRSNGDPTMASRYLSDRNPASVLRGWIADLKKLGIKKIEGDCVIDASAFGPDQDVYPAAWDQSYRTHSYANPPSAIALNENLIRVSVNPASADGAKGRVSLFPAGDGVGVVNKTSSSTGRTYGLDARFQGDNRTLLLMGRVGRGVKTHVVEVPLPEPNFYVSGIVREALRNEGIAMGGSARIIRDRAEAAKLGNFSPTAWHESIPLIDLMRIMMVNSDNFLAEQIWRGTAARAKGDGSLASTRRLEQEWLGQLGLPWIEPGHDGCGLSRDNRVAAAELVAILESVYTSPYQQYLMNCLPVSGRSGTLRGRSMGKEPGRVIAKTGTLSGAASLSGFIRDKQGNPRWGFAVIGNAGGNTNGRLTMRGDQIIKIMLGLLDEGFRPGAVTTPVVSIKKYEPGTKQYVGNAS